MPGFSMTPKSVGSFKADAAATKAKVSAAVRTGVFTLEGLVAAEIDRTWSKKSKGPGPLIDTGAMLGSVRSRQTSATTGEVQVGADYAAYINFGTRRMQAYPFFDNAVKRFKPMWTALVKAAVG